LEKWGDLAKSASLLLSVKRADAFSNSGRRKQKGDPKLAHKEKSQRVGHRALRFTS
jgi:hypothetical protein